MQHLVSFYFRNNYKDYYLLSRLHFRIHAVQTEIRAKLKAQKYGSSHEEDVNDVDQLMPYAEEGNSASHDGTTNFEIPKTEDEAKKMIQAR